MHVVVSSMNTMLHKSGRDGKRFAVIYTQAMRSPTLRMQSLANRWLTDTIEYGDINTDTDVNPATGAVTYNGSRATTPALVRQAEAVRDSNGSVEYQVRDLTVWLPLDITITAGDLIGVTTCAGDVSLVGLTGTVTDVERDSIRAVRRVGVRLENYR